MLLDAPGRALRFADVPTPEPGPRQLLIRVAACGVCRTDLHIVDGELPDPKLPLILGHEIVGHVAGLGQGASRFALGARVGVPWLARTD
jgi:propanol-preferring alcohol dehydrogenase